MQGVAFANPFKSKKAPFEGPEGFDGLQCIMGTAWGKSAAVAQIGADG
jgi:hypothetical protein